MHKEQWIQFPCTSHVQKKYYFESFYYKNNTVVILLNDPDDDTMQIKVVFDTCVKAVRTTNESYAYKTIDILNDVYGGAFYSKYTFFAVLRSDYAALFEDQQPLVHYVLIPVDWIIDIVSSQPPIITPTNKDNNL